MIPENCLEWLQSQYDKARSYQTGNGIKFELTFNEYLGLWSRDRLQKLSKLIADEEITRRQKHPLYAWVLSWKTKQAWRDGVMDNSTARILTRENSEKRFLLQKGEKHSAEAKAKIGAAHRGKTISDDHRKAVGDARRGKPQTPEQIEKRVASTAATKAWKAAEKAAHKAATTAAVNCERQRVAHDGAMHREARVTSYHSRLAPGGSRNMSSTATTSEAHA